MANKSICPSEQRKKTCFKSFGVGQIANVCKREKKRMGTIKNVPQGKIWIGPRVPGKNNRSDSESVEPQVVN